MQRLHQAIYVVSLLALSWLGMMVIHELGHVIGALLTGGNVQSVVLHPFRISRTDVSPNPRPLIVVWSGPVLGCLLPVLMSRFVPRRNTLVRGAAVFFAGFCLVGNGAYIGLGAFNAVGDCRVMLQYGSPFWLLVSFGSVMILAGLIVWHRLGSVRRFFSQPSFVDPQSAYFLLGAVVIMFACELALF